MVDNNPGENYKRKDIVYTAFMSALIGFSVGMTATPYFWPPTRASIVEDRNKDGRQDLLVDANAQKYVLYNLGAAGNQVYVSENEYNRIHSSIREIKDLKIDVYGTKPSNVTTDLGGLIENGN